MTADTLHEAVRNLTSRRPFARYRVHLVDGRTLSVEHPEWLFVVAGRATLLERGGRYFYFDADTVSCIEEPSAEPRRKKPKR